MTRKREPGTGSVQKQRDKWRFRLPGSMVVPGTTRWVGPAFETEEECHRFGDAAIRAAREGRDAREEEYQIDFAAVFARYVQHCAQHAKKRHGIRSQSKVRSRLQGMERNWFARRQCTFWRTPLPLITGHQIQEFLEWVQLYGMNQRGEPVSDSWVNQLDQAVRGVFRLVRRECPSYEVDTETGRVKTALNLAHQKRFFQVIEDPRDRIIAGCQMGAGLRIWELLSLLECNVHLGADPYLTIETGGPDGAPTKSRQPRRVELFEPGLGFFRLARQFFYRPNDRGLLFCGPNSGYLSSWPEKFVGWSEKMGMRVVSHGMRHAYAFSMLSGSWGHAPMDITFVSRQLGHQDIRTTQKAYGHWDPGAGLVTARLLRGETAPRSEVVTAEELLGGRAPSVAHAPSAAKSSANTSRRSPTPPHKPNSPGASEESGLHRSLLTSKTPGESINGVSDGN